MKMLYDFVCDNNIGNMYYDIANNSGQQIEKKLRENISNVVAVLFARRVAGSITENFQDL